MEKVNLEKFKKTILEKKTFVMFSAEWCGECKMNTPMIESKESLFPDINFIKIDVDENQLWSEDNNSEFNIMSVPIFMVFENGQKIREHIGFSSLDKIEEVIKG